MTEMTLDPRQLGTGGLFTAAVPDLASHEAAYGRRPSGWTRSPLLRELEASGLAGRGGAGFPAWRKLAAVGAGRPAVIANGAEGEPLSRKDTALLRQAPHLVLDGLVTAGEAVGASELFLYATAESLPGVGQALAERRDGPRVTLVEAPAAFISGEASAVVNALETGTALPRDKAARIARSGYQGRPTLLHNVETLAHLALVARYGAQWFRSAGTADDPGTRLYSLSGDVPAEWVVEAPGGASLRDVLRLGGAEPSSLAAVLVGGFHGAWVPAEAFDLPLTARGLARYGASPGAGVLLALARGRCGLQASAGIVRYLAESSARQCGPCMFGLPAMATVLERIAAGERAPWLASEAERLAGLVTGRGACHHPDGSARFVRSSLGVFKDEVRAHLAGACTAHHGRV
ncbi:NADH-ubiquinone oxidoreductase-F iron-sulfur binding region domain-containing protein [Sinomonas susongensis]|uniref:NADH-ubiquinone oxidoreductase-F iron-sulfur binding region domain-containing protein n=1 Tax=Sinomonas susongensis TaxID=1324851 RepID=UPI001108E907|nr:NADH-ubiquinone oxidoreductase-F iron-sulfur binding region domain-containing protein [Sinomonas susongensis]